MIEISNALDVAFEQSFTLHDGTQIKTSYIEQCKIIEKWNNVGGIYEIY